MPSPFPGMDPYLEGYLWPDVHAALANKIRQQLTPHLRPRYVARLDISVVVDASPEAEIGIMYPDVEVVKVGQQISEAKVEYSALIEEESEEESPEKAAILPAPLTLPLLGPVEVRLVSVEVRDTANNELITSIELLSPVNKREPGLTKYRQKQQRLRQSGVHLLEIDLLRRGERVLGHPHLPNVPYLATLIRAQARQVEVWPIALKDPLPILPVPLRAPDPDVPLALGSALESIYEEAAYDLSIDYAQPPPPPELPADEMAWLAEQVRDFPTPGGYG